MPLAVAWPAWTSAPRPVTPVQDKRATTTVCREIARMFESRWYAVRMANGELTRRTGIPLDRLQQLLADCPMTVDEHFTIAQALDLDPVAVIREATAHAQEGSDASRRRDRHQSDWYGLRALFRWAD